MRKPRIPSESAALPANVSQQRHTEYWYTAKLDSIERINVIIVIAIELYATILLCVQWLISSAGWPVSQLQRFRYCLDSVSQHLGRLPLKNASREAPSSRRNQPFRVYNV